MSLSLMSMIIMIISAHGLKEKKHVPNSVVPQETNEVYNLEGWVNLLHLQQCVFVAVGESNFAVFLETRPRPFDVDQEIQDYFLGLCDSSTLQKWKLCPASLEKKRSVDCIFAENGQSSQRVHRRFCELSDLAMFGDVCNCNNSSSTAEQSMFRVVGFPTCYRQPLPDTLCGQNNVCGINECISGHIANKIYGVKCDEDCFGRRPFCEMPDWESAKPREITSFWTDWSEPICANSDCQSQIMEARCVNKKTGNGDIDCLGPGTSCCPNDVLNCKCHIFVEDGGLKVMRMYFAPKQQDDEEIPIEDIINNLPLKTENQRQNKHKSALKNIRFSLPKSKLEDTKKRFWEHSKRHKRHDITDSKSEDFVDYLKSMQGWKLVRASEDDDDDDDDDDFGEDDDEDDIMIEEETENEVIITTEQLERDEMKAEALLKIHENGLIIDVPNRTKTKEDSGVTTCRLSLFLLIVCLFYYL